MNLNLNNKQMGLTYRSTEHFIVFIWFYRSCLIILIIIIIIIIISPFSELFQFVALNLTYPPVI